MKTRNLIGGAIVVAFIAGGFLGGYFPKLGLGPGGGNGFGRSNDVRGHAVKTVARQPPPDADRDQGSVLHVRIDGRSYAIVRGESAQPIPLEQLVAEVQNYPGNSHGIRVRVSRLPSSKTTAELQLRDALVQAGLSEEAIDWQDGPRP